MGKLYKPHISKIQVSQLKISNIFEQLKNDRNKQYNNLSDHIVELRFKCFRNIIL